MYYFTPPKFLWFALISLVLGATVIGTAQSCAISVSATDSVCTGFHDCLSTTGCTSISFTANCTGKYDLKAETICSRGDCEDFNACVNVYEGGTRIGENCHVLPCSDCTEMCASAVCLEAHHNYTLYVCLTPCEPTDTCSTPGASSCKALGTVNWNSGATCQ